ncbi:MAG: hypothetical protein FWD86_00855 [Firmicutes bacterium]|nr:hypothetical protein [Bacillota bacterium]
MEWYHIATIIISSVVGTCSIVTLVFLTRQLRHQNEVKAFSVFEDLFNKNLVMKKALQRCNSCGEIANFLAKKSEMKNRSDFIETLIEFEDLHDLSLYYEFLGAILKSKSVDRKAFFDLFSFPDTFWLATHEMRKLLIEVKYSDFWDNFVWLHNFYFDQRLKKGLEPTFDNYKGARNLEYKKLNLLGFLKVVLDAKRPISFHPDILEDDVLKGLKLNTEVSERLKAIRESKALKTVGLARAISVSTEEYLEYENIQQERVLLKKDTETFLKICIFLRVTIKDLFPKCLED